MCDRYSYLSERNFSVLISKRNIFYPLYRHVKTSHVRISKKTQKSVNFSAKKLCSNHSLLYVTIFTDADIGSLKHLHKVL